MKEFLYAFVAWMQSYGIVGLMVVAFAGSSFFPIPPDILLIPMIFINRKYAMVYALATTVFSVLGAFFGYYVGRKLGKPILNKLFKPDHIQRVEHSFSKYGAWSIGIAGFTPMPYKLFTIASGVFNISISTFTIASVIGRGARFFLEALFILILGDRALYYLETYFGVITILIALLCILAYALFKYMIAPQSVEGLGVIDIIKTRYRHYHSRISKYNSYGKTLASTIIIICMILLVVFLFTFITYIL